MFILFFFHFLSCQLLRLVTLSKSNHNFILMSSNSQFAATIPRPFSVRYNPYTQSVEILNSKPQIQSLVREINCHMQVLTDALVKLS